MKPNTLKSGYKETPLGPLPVDWDVYELGKLVDEKRPVSYGIVQTGEPVEGGIKCIRVTDIIDGKIDSAKLITTSKKISDSYKRTQLKRGDLVMALRGKIGQIAMIEDELVGANLTRGVALIALKSTLDREFIKQKIASEETTSILERSLNGSALQELSIGVLRKIPISVPSLRTEQTAIANLLSTWDKAIVTTSELIAQKEERKKWLMQQLLTGKKRLKRQNQNLQNERIDRMNANQHSVNPANSVNSDSDNGEGFGEWKEVHLGELFDERNETKQTGLPLLSVGAQGIYPQSDSIKKDTSNEDKSKYLRICPGDIGYNTMRMWQGRSALSELEGIISPAYTVVTPKANTNSKYFSYLFQVKRVIHDFWRHSQGLVDDTLNCKFKDFAIVKVVVPISKDEQSAIAKILQTADDEIELLNKKRDELKEQKKGLMQVLLTGKKRLKIKRPIQLETMSGSENVLTK